VNNGWTKLLGVSRPNNHFKRDARTRQAGIEVASGRASKKKIPCLSEVGLP